MKWVPGSARRIGDKALLPVLLVVALAVAGVWVVFNAALTAAVARDLVVDGPNGRWIDIPLGSCGTVFFAAMAGVPVGAAAGLAGAFHERVGRICFVVGLVLGGVGVPWLLWHSGVVPPLGDFSPSGGGDGG
ncbi:hypothetical protein [Embleya sp. NPDC020886]|uniref:hypothetical protein n=1 Tax=Embleya sp. NPDC020886 TaxID=3363980 RepID=UPI0037BC803C